MKAYKTLCNRPNLAIASCNGGCIASLHLTKTNLKKNICCCSINRLTTAELAFEMNAREFLAHDCCQRFVLRLLYGNLQIRTLSTSVKFLLFIIE